jgi:integrase
MLAVEGCLDVIRKRPVSVTKSSKGARPISPSYAAAVVKQFRVFLRWLHRSSDWEWAKPRDYEVLPVRVVRTEHDRRRVGPHQVQTYGIDELIAVWGYATPRVRAYVALALNCAFGGAELASLRCDEVLLDAPHPYSRTLNLSNPVGSWIFRDRRKTGVYGEWRLWPMTVRAVRWALARRGDSPLPQLLLTRTGKPLDTATVANNKNAKIQNLWASTLRRVRADDPKFPVLSFNKLRKTAANMVRVEAGAEAASLMLAHGRGGEDDLLDVYTDRPFASLHSALSLLDARLQRVWDAAADPFPEGDEKMGGANISRGKIRQLQSLHRAGLKVAEICKRAEVSRVTVRRWCGGGG